MQDKVRVTVGEALGLSDRLKRRMADTLPQLESVYELGPFLGLIFHLIHKVFIVLHKKIQIFCLSEHLI